MIDYKVDLFTITTLEMRPVFYRSYGSPYDPQTLGKAVRILVRLYIIYNMDSFSAVITRMIL